MFPCINIRLLFLFNTSTRSKKACNQTCRILEMQLLTPQWGRTQMRYLSIPAFTLFKSVGFPVHQKALLLAHQLPFLQPHNEVAWHGRNRMAIYNPRVQHTGSVVCISITQNRGWGLVFKQLILIGVKHPRIALMFSFLFCIKLPPNYCCSTIPRYRNCPRFHIIYKTSPLSGDYSEHSVKQILQLFF